MNWSKAFKDTRHKLDLSVIGLAELLKVTRQTIYNIESGQCSPSPELIEAYLDLTNQDLVLKPRRKKDSIEEAIK